jgi:N-acetylated-alpha-linked acidic dipeptidase
VLIVGCVACSSPHVAGTQQDYETAVYTAQQFEAFGLQAEIKEYFTLLSMPVRHRLAIVEPARAAREINMTEASVPGDACTSDEAALPSLLSHGQRDGVSCVR